MDKRKILKVISGLGVGIGVGVCFGAAMNNIVAGIMLGLGVGMCFAVAFTSNGQDDKKIK
jgi:cyanate permease